METIDKRKRLKAGREVLLEQGITDEEKIAAILNSLNEEEDNRSVDTTAAVHRGRAGNQRQRAPHRGPRVLVLDQAAVHRVRAGIQRQRAPRYQPGAGPDRNLVAARPRNLVERPNANQARRNAHLARFRRMANMRAPAALPLPAPAPVPAPLRNQNEAVAADLALVEFFLTLASITWLTLILVTLLTLTIWQDNETFLIILQITATKIAIAGRLLMETLLRIRSLALGGLVVIHILNMYSQQILQHLALALVLFIVWVLY